MAKHEFGIMMDAPQQGKRYDEYEPWKYACISVDDAYLEGVAERLTSIDFYWHTLSVKVKVVATLAAEISSAFLSYSMANMHGTITEITEFDFEDYFM